MAVVCTLLFLGLLFSLGFAGEIPLDNLCLSDGGGKIILFKAQECTDFPCTVVWSKSYKGELTFTPGRNSSTETIKCGSVVWGKPQTIANWNACDELTGPNRCPIIAGQEYTYETTIKIPPVPPGIYTVHCDIVDDGGVKQICARGTVRVVPW